MARTKRAPRSLDEVVAELDRKHFKTDEPPLLVVSMWELADKDVAYAAAPWRRRATTDALFNTTLRCDAVAIARYGVRGQAVIQAMQELCERTPVPSVARYIFSRPRARALLAWLEEQPRSEARDTIRKPLRRAVTRKHAFSIVFDTV